MPVVRDPEPGGSYWAVVVGLAPDPADLERPVQALEAAGYPDAQVGSLSCLQGAQEALGVSAEAAESSAAYLLFADRSGAQRFVRQYGEEYAEGVASVRTYCLD